MIYVELGTAQLLHSVADGVKHRQVPSLGLTQDTRMKIPVGLICVPGYLPAAGDSLARDQRSICLPWHMLLKLAQQFIGFTLGNDQAQVMNLTIARQ